MKPKVLVTRMIPRAGIELLDTYCEVEINNEDRSLSRVELLEKVRNKTGVIGVMADRVDGEFFDAAPQLRGYMLWAMTISTCPRPPNGVSQFPTRRTC